MNIWESIVTAWQSIYSNKMRSVLTILGIVIGISAVVFLVSFGRGHVANITAIFESMGANAMYVTSASGGISGRLAGITGSLTLEDAEALANPNKAPAVYIVAPTVQKMSTIAFGNERRQLGVSGVTPEIAEVTSYPVESGEFISERDIKEQRDVVVLGSKIASDMFGKDDPLGQAIRIGGRRFEVIGVLEPKGSFMGGADEYVLIPLTTMQSRLIGETTTRGRPVQLIAVRAVSTEEVDAAKEQITAILRQRHHIREGQDDDFNVLDMRELMKQMQQVLGILQVFLGAVGSISLVVGGIGIMNIMLVSVTERTREIGIRKAIGAKRRDILWQFLIESAMLSLTGGIIGLTLAFIGTRAVTGVNLGGYSVKAPMSLDIVIIAVSVAIFVGLASGFYPAFRAASLDPIESLRHE